MLKDSEELAYALYLADYQREYNQAGPMRSFASSRLSSPKSWEELGPFKQERYLGYVNTAFQWLFEHGRVSTYVNKEQLAEFELEYYSYLEALEKDGRLHGK